MFISPRLIRVVAALSLSAIAVAVVAGPANAITPPSISWSSVAIAQGQTVTLTTTNTVGLFSCIYLDDQLFAPASGDVITTEATNSPFTYDMLAGITPGATEFTFAVFGTPDISCPLTKTEALVSTRGSASLAITPAPAPTAVFSNPTIADGETVTLTTTNTVGLLSCTYLDDQLYAAATEIVVAEADNQALDYATIADIVPGASEFTITWFPSSVTECPLTKVDALLSDSAFVTLSIIRQAEPTTAPTNEPETLATTGQNTTALLSVFALLLTAGLGALAVRRRTAKR